jgi:hypothetical protein
MKRRIVIAGVLAGAATLLIPVLAYGQSAQPTTPTTAPSEFLGLSPQSGAPGDEVLVSVGCTLPVGAVDARSAILDIGPLKPVKDPGTSPRYEAVATVKKDVAPGAYPVSANCGRHNMTANFTVTEAGLPVWLSLSPQSGRPGQQVSVQISCQADTTGSLISAALRETEKPARDPDGHMPWALFGTAVVADVAPGSYPVTFDCGGKKASGKFTVLGAGQPGAGRPGTGQVTVIPQGAPQTGGGGTAD